MIEEDPLVSIIVITYNSAKYVLETLESAKAQTYHNIELIISDDCSTDNTVEICREWLENNESRFVRTELITVEKNTGIPANCNRGVKAAIGEWVKLIAGDDAIYHNAISSFVKFVYKDSNIKFCYSDFDSYIENFTVDNLVTKINRKEKLRRLGLLDSALQLRLIVRSCIIPTPGTFLNKKEFEKVKFFDESYYFIEDWPTWYNVINRGYKFFFLDEKTYKYRIHGNSITQNNKKSRYSQIKRVQTIIKDRFYKYYSVDERIIFHIKQLYYKYFDSSDELKFFGKLLRRILYQAIIIEEVRNDKLVYKLSKNK